MEAVEAILCYFFENWLMKLKCPNPRTSDYSVIRGPCLTSEIHRYLHFDIKVVFSWSPRSSKYNKSGRRALYVYILVLYQNSIKAT